MMKNDLVQILALHNILDHNQDWHVYCSWFPSNIYSGAHWMHRSFGHTIVLPLHGRPWVLVLICINTKAMDIRNIMDSYLLWLPDCILDTFKGWSKMRAGGSQRPPWANLFASMLCLFSGLKTQVQHLYSYSRRFNHYLKASQFVKYSWTEP